MPTDEQCWSYPAWEDTIGKWAVQRRHNGGTLWALLHGHGEVVGDPAMFDTEQDARDFAAVEAEWTGHATRVVLAVRRSTYSRAFVPVDGDES